jgi:enamine deaminase RidA (YjgF/YER057c/UK114 family)
VPVELINPDGLPKPEFYAQLNVATGTRTVYLSGQVARDAQGQPVGAGDLAAQVEQAYLDVATALAGVGGSFDDVAKLTPYVVDWDGSQLAGIGEGGGAGRAAAGGVAAQAHHAHPRRGVGRARSADRGGSGGRARLSGRLSRADGCRADRKSAPGRIRTCAPASGGQCSIP